MRQPANPEQALNSPQKKPSKRALLKALAKPNTLKTTWGYLLTLARRMIPVGLQRKSLPAIYNYLPISENLSTSGQPTEKQLAEIVDAGFKTVINLAPANAENALPDEAGSLQSLGATYIHIPVDFKRPSEADFERFTQALEAHNDQKLWVHCAANMRVSAFIYRYRCELAGEDPSIASGDLHKIWTPFGVWRKFIERPARSD